MSPTAAPAPRLHLAVVACGPLAVVAGLLAHRMWEVLPWERFALALVLAGLAAAGAWPLQRYTRLGWPAALALVWLAALVLFVGPVPVATVALLAAAALVLGWPLVPAGMPGRTALACTLGLVLIAGVTGWLLRLPLHTVWFWLPLMGAAVVWRRRCLVLALREAWAGFAQTAGGASRWASASVMLLGLASTACWIPTMQVDDLAYHLGLPAQLLAHGRYQPDPLHQVWALAPWSGDVLQGIASVGSGGDARGAVNALWLLLTAALAWSLAAGLTGSATVRWAAVAVFASFPPLVWMAAGMQTELPAAAVLMAMTTMLVAERPGRLVPVAILLAGLAALKAIHLLAAAPLVGFALWRHRHRLRWRQLPLVLGICLAVGASSYVQAWWLTGNPMLPVFNNVFASPYFPTEAYVDPRWHSGFSPALLWTTAFDTPRYVEAFRGGLGFTALALAGVWLLALLRPAGRGLAIALSLVVIVPLIPMQYLRYTYPGLLVLGVYLVARSAELLDRRLFGLGLATLCVLNLAFQANAGWTHHSSAHKRVLRSGSDPAQVLPHYVPERSLIARIPASDEGNVLATHPQRPYIAELGLRGRSVMEHAPHLARAHAEAEADPSGAGWSRLFALSGARWALVVPGSASPALLAGLQASGATQVDAEHDATLWRLPDVSPP